MALLECKETSQSLHIVRDISLYNLFYSELSLQILIQFLFDLQDPPFIKLKDNSHLLFGNDRYEGYCIEILEKMKDLLNFRYEIYLLQDAELSGGELRVRTLDDKQDLVVQEIKMGVSIFSFLGVIAYARAKNVFLF